MEAPKVKGQRSPRWAFMAKMLIECKKNNGVVPYLFRLRIIQTPWFGIYLHDIFEPDGDRDPHNHPWSFISIILRGSYTELVYPFPEKAIGSNLFYEEHWKRFSFHRMGRESAHRITEASPGLKTLILTGPRRGNWGFFTPQGFMEWQDYERQQ